MADTFDYFDDHAKRSVAAAMQEARRYGHTYIGTEHVLLGITQQKGEAAALALGSQGVEEHDLRENFEALVGHGGEEESDEKPVPNASCKKAMQRALREAFDRKADAVSTGHLLMSILADTNSVAYRVVEASGGRSSYVKKALNSLLSEEGPPGDNPGEGSAGSGGGATATPPPPEQGGESDKGSGRSGGKKRGGAQSPGAPSEVPEGFGKNSRKTLETYGKNLTAAARSGSLDPVVGREAEVQRMKRILGRRSKNNPALTGPPGTGKTACVEGLAQEIAEGRVSETLKRKEIYALDLSALVAGSKYRGEFEERMKKVVEEASNDPNVVLFIDEMHTIIGAGSAEGSIDAAQILKPPLSRAEIQLIGATTTDEYRRHVEKDKALERRFQPVAVEEPTIEAAIRMLTGSREHYEHHHRVEVTASAIEAAVRLSDRYISDRYLPDKAIDLLDETCSEARASATEAEIAELEKPVTKQDAAVPEGGVEITNDEQGGPSSSQGALTSSPAHEEARERVASAEEVAARDRQAVEDAVKRKDFASLADLREKASASEDKAKEARRSEREERKGAGSSGDSDEEAGDGNLPAPPDGDAVPDKEDDAEAIASDSEPGSVHPPGRPPDAEGRYPVAVGEREVQEMVSRLTGVPEGKVSAGAGAALASLEGVLHRRVVGQRRAVSAISRAIRRQAAGLKEEGRPAGSFLFLGPTGTGKTQTAKALASHLFGSEAAMVRLDMSEYQERHAAARLTGAPPGYVGYEDAGQLTEDVRKKPYSVVLFDEIEKAHPDVYDILLQILDDGRLTDSSGTTVDFTNTVVIMTSNAGASRLSGNSSTEFSIGFHGASGPRAALRGAPGEGAADDGATPGPDASGDRAAEESPDGPDSASYQRMKRKAMMALREVFRPEFLNRVDETVVFHQLGRAQIREILDIELESLLARMRRSLPDVSFEFSEEAMEKMAQAGYEPEYGARPLKRMLVSAVADPVSELMVEGRLSAGATLRVADNGTSLEGHSGDYSEEPILGFEVEE